MRHLLNVLFGLVLWNLVSGQSVLELVIKFFYELNKDFFIFNSKSSLELLHPSVLKIVLGIWSLVKLTISFHSQVSNSCVAFVQTHIQSSKWCRKMSFTGESVSRAIFDSLRGAFHSPKEINHPHCFTTVFVLSAGQKISWSLQWDLTFDQIETIHAEETHARTSREMLSFVDLFFL